MRVAIRRAARVVFSVVLAAGAGCAASGCTHVAAYDRAKLAHPTMTSIAFEGPAASHVLSVHEGATGGGELSETGCGCN